MFACLALLKHTYLNAPPLPLPTRLHQPHPRHSTLSFFILFWRRLACLSSLGGGQAGLGRTGRTSGDTLSVNLPTATVAHQDAQSHARTHTQTNTHTRTRLDWSQSPPSACLYVGLLCHGMCYINVWMRMNWCWNESFDIWKVQKVRLLQAVRASVSLKKSLEGSLCSKCCLASDSWEAWKPMFLFLTFVSSWLCRDWFKQRRKKRTLTSPVHYYLSAEYDEALGIGQTRIYFEIIFSLRTEWLKEN